MSTPRPAARRLALAAVALVAATLAVVTVLAPPEHCPEVSTDNLRASAGGAVNWFVRNQYPDGTWLYEYDAAADRVIPGYNTVRHSGAVMGLYQAASAGVPGAFDAADRGLVWSLAHLVEGDGWTAVLDGTQAPAGGTALLVAGLVERRALTGDSRYDDLLQRMGRFLVAQTEPSGAVAAFYDIPSGTVLPGQYSKYYTGETYWAVARLHRAFPDAGFGAVADRIGAYLATSRDRVEDYWPPLPDHWVGYGLAETATWPDRDAAQPLTADELAYARRQAGLFGAQVRWLGQRFGRWGAAVRGTHVPRGGGYGVVGEALTGLWRAAGADSRLASVQAAIGDRAVCVAGLAVRAQTSGGEAAAFASPGRVDGAWFRDGVTRMDDQQHALDALLRTIAIVEAQGGASDGRSSPASAWLWAIALIAAWNPARVWSAVPRPGAARRATLGGASGSVLALALALVVAAVAAALDISDSSLRLAVGVVGGVVAVIAVLGRPPSPEPGLRGTRAALVPLAVPLVANPALVLLSAGALADVGVAPVLLALLAATGLLVALAAGVPAQPVPRRVMAWGARTTGAVLLATAVVLVIDGVMGV